MQKINSKDNNTIFFHNNKKSPLKKGLNIIAKYSNIF